jgi:molecular chaperone DnaJ
MDKNYYEILGINKDANSDEIKKAYRKAAMQHHPDKGGDEAQFKKIQEAYDVLSDETKKYNYDRWGTTGQKNDFFNFDDLFSAFGMRSPFSQQRRKAQDVVVQVSLSLDEVINGAQKRVRYRRKKICKSCSGMGALEFEHCKRCQGRGQYIEVINTPFGQMSTATNCPKCNGRGKSVTKSCNQCHGNGTSEHEETLDLNIPIGSIEGHILAMSGAGHEARDHINGDLHILIQEIPDHSFIRQGLNLLHDIHISISDAVLGCDVQVDSPTGKFNVVIPKGCDSGRVFTLNSKGIPSREGKGQGDLLVKVNIKIPKILTHEQRELFEQLKNIE